jgi:hypothetical protein
LGRLVGKDIKLKNLLNMMDKSSDLAEEVGFNQNQVYMVYVPASCPHERDKKGHIWINGKLFKAWAEEVYQKRTLKPGEAFCLTCKRAVKIVNLVRHRKDRLIYDLSDCPICERKLTRIIDHKKRLNDRS